MVIKDISMVIKHFKRDGEKRTSEAIALHNASRFPKRINPFVPGPTKQSDWKWKEIPYEKLVIIAELLK